MECFACTFADYSRALALSTRATAIVSLSHRNSFFSIYGIRIDWKRTGLVGVYIVSFFIFKIQSCHEFQIFKFEFEFKFSAKSLRTSSNVFVINLAICDFLMMSKVPILIYNSFHRGMALGPLWCETYGLIGAISGVGAAITNAFIAYDRCVLAV